MNWLSFYKWNKCFSFTQNNQPTLGSNQLSSALLCYTMPSPYFFTFHQKYHTMYVPSYSNIVRRTRPQSQIQSILNVLDKIKANVGLRLMRNFFLFKKSNCQNPICTGGGAKQPPLDLFLNNFFIVARIDLKFSVNSQLSFSDHMKFFRDRSGS